MEEEIVELFSAEDDRATGTSHVDPWDVVYNVSLLVATSKFHFYFICHMSCVRNVGLCNSSKAAGNKIHSLIPFHVLCRCY